jgi:flagellar protein FliO/FliZ
MFDLFGDLGTPAKFFIAFSIVLALIALTAWLVRRFGANRLSSAARGRQPRLAVIDAASVDGRRRLILIRRDNVEHLLMIGGPTDVVVEQNIVRAVAGRDSPRVAMPGDTLPRALPLGDAASWPLQPEPMSVPTPTPRSYRSASDEPWIPPETPARQQTEPSAPLSSAALPPDLTGRLGADLGVPPARSAPPVAAPLREPAPSPEPVGSAQNHHNLAEMAQRLEAALRRPGGSDIHPSVTDPLAAAPANASREARSSRSEPRLESKVEPRIEPRAEPRPAPGKSAYDSLEQEMASLLGRPSGKT